MSSETGAVPRAPHERGQGAAKKAERLLFTPPKIHKIDETPPWRSRPVDENNVNPTPWRGIEVILRAAIRATPGPFTERICGVCTGAHALTSVCSVENALAINIPENTNSTRNIMPLAPQVHVLIVDFYHLHAVDVVSADPKAPRRWRSRSRPGWLVQGAQRPKTSGRCSFLTRWMRSLSIRSKSAIRRSPPARRKWIFATAPRGCGKSTRPILNELRKPWERAGNL